MAASQHKHKLLHNCSGKHAGMLLACVRAGWDPETYLRASHPLQRRVTRAVRRATGLEDLTMSVDGCGVPVHGMPLRSMATLFARLTATERLGDLAPAADRVTEAMRSEPYLVGGRNRVDTDLMRTTPDVVAKSGAEALECAAVLPSGLGVAVKIEDGGSRASAPALIRVLEQIDVLSADDLRAVGAARLAPGLGWRQARRSARSGLRPAVPASADRQEAVTRYATSRVTSLSCANHGSPCSPCTRRRWISPAPATPAA